jgi:hypothetical protein
MSQVQDAESEFFYQGMVCNPCGCRRTRRLWRTDGERRRIILGDRHTGIDASS